MNPVKESLLWVTAIVITNVMLASWLLPQPQPQFQGSGATPVLNLGDVPTDTQEAIEHAYQSLRQRLPWGAEKSSENTAAKTEPTQTPARFAGVLYEGQQAYMLMLNPASQLQRYRVGDSLPDEAQRLLAIRPDAVDLEKEQQRQTLYLYPH
jgi:hypothetical protein